MLRVVAIDGAAGSGKSTLARRLSRALELPYVNTGSMYRALTRAARRQVVDIEDEATLVGLMETLRFTLSPGPSGELLIDGALPSADLETGEVESSVSAVAAHPGVRSAMRAAQRSLGEGGAVMEGRDIGTVVFPDAPVKLFLVAEPVERAGRRVEERGASDEAGALHERDRRDSMVNPLVPAADAVVIDTSDLDVDATLRAALAVVAERAPALLPPERSGAMSVPRIAVVGRQNVGKSTLVNRLFGRREAIAHDDPGVTRDRVELEATWNGRHFGLVDTAGYLHGARGVEALAGKQSMRAIEEAQLVLLIVDVASGITEEDAQLARRLRRATAPVLVVVNKVDTAEDEHDVASFLALGLGDPIPVSSKHGRGVGELLDRLVDLLPEAPEASGGWAGGGEAFGGEAAGGGPDDRHEEPRFALVGRPNVGKSSLFNKLVKDERSVVFEEAGTTRDSVDALVEWPGAGQIRFVDTAGMRRAIRVKGVEYYSFVRAGDAIDRADAAAVIFDAVEGITAEDQKIAFRVLEAGRGLLLIANKWDLVEDKDRRFKELTEDARMLARATVVRTSAVRGQGVMKIPELLLDLRTRWAGRAPTSRVNQMLQEVQGAQPPPRSSGTLHYAAQVATRPPSFVFFGGGRAPTPGYRRYLENRFREALHLDGVPIRMRFRPRTRGR